eukprot:Gb_11590 [translate_table: standard]
MQKNPLFHIIASNRGCCNNGNSGSGNNNNSNNYSLGDEDKGLQWFVEFLEKCALSLESQGNLLITKITKGMKHLIDALDSGETWIHIEDVKEQCRVSGEKLTLGNVETVDIVKEGKKPYNATLSLHQLVENADECIVLDSETLRYLLQNLGSHNAHIWRPKPFDFCNK